MVYKHAYLNTLLLLHTAFVLSLVKMGLKGAVGGNALNSHGNNIVDRGKSRKNHGIVFLNFCGNPVIYLVYRTLYLVIPFINPGNQVPGIVCIYLVL